MKRTLRVAVCLVGVAGLLAGCASVPSQEMSDARRAVSLAEAAAGAKYSPSGMREASSLLARAGRALEAGDYQEARRAADGAKQLALETRTTAMAVAAAQAVSAEAHAAGRVDPEVDAYVREAVAAAHAGNHALARRLAGRAMARRRDQ